VIRAVTPGFRRALDFWQVHSEGPGRDVTLTVVDDLDQRGLRDAVVCAAGRGEPGLHVLSDGARLYARVRPVAEVPSGWESLAAIRDHGGRTVSHIMRDRIANVVYVPFVFDEAIEGFEFERYTSALGGRIPPAMLSAYYRVKPIIPRALVRELRSMAARRADHGARFPRWPLEDSLERLRGLFALLVLEVAGVDSMPFTWFWPDGHDYCLLATHDVETASGRDNIERFIERERGMGIRSSFNLVPGDYVVPDSLVSRIRAEGFEVGVHGWTHDGLLFSDWAIFTERVRKMREIAGVWGATGFRSPATHRRYDWFHALGFDYDASAPDSDPYEPQSGGCLSLFPFFVGDVLEIPITMPQDHTLFGLLKESGGEIWSVKAGEIVRRNGCVCMLTHPDPMRGYAGSEEVMAHYFRFLEERLSAPESAWNALPCELSAWWRARRDAGAGDGGFSRPGDGAEAAGMRLGTLRREEGRLVIEPPEVGGMGPGGAGAPRGETK
jgi:hypothetical protein